MNGTCGPCPEDPGLLLGGPVGLLLPSVQDLLIHRCVLGGAQPTVVLGGLVLALGLAALFLPEVARSSGALVVGELLLIAGLLEVIAATGRRAARWPSTLAGIVTVAAGAMFLAREETRFAISSKPYTISCPARSMGGTLRTGGKGDLRQGAHASLSRRTLISSTASR